MKKRIDAKKRAYSIEKLWLESFAYDVKQKTGKFMPYTYKWENYSFGKECALKNTNAEQAYNQQHQEDYYLFNESLSEVWECIEEPFPTTLAESEDWYIFPKTGKWTMIYTHEGFKFFAKNRTKRIKITATKSATSSITESR